MCFSKSMLMEQFALVVFLVYLFLYSLFVRVGRIDYLVGWKSSTPCWSWRRAAPTCLPSWSGVTWSYWLLFWLVEQYSLLELEESSPDLPALMVWCYLVVLIIILVGRAVQPAGAGGEQSRPACPHGLVWSGRQVRGPQKTHVWISVVDPDPESCPSLDPVPDFLI